MFNCWTSLARGTVARSVSMDIIGCGVALGGLKCRWLDGLQLLEAMRCDGGALGCPLCQVEKWLV